MSSNPITFLGISLGGGKTDKACMAVLDYYPSQDRIFLVKIYEKIKSDDKLSGDLKIHELIEQYKLYLKYICFDVPWRQPLCLQCLLPCPGFESCQEPHILWMWKNYLSRFAAKRPKRLFTPYTQRAAELHILTELEEPFFVPHAMGANTAPLLARAHFIKRRLVGSEAIEVNPDLSVWRLGHALGVGRHHLKRFRNMAGGEESRSVILESFSRVKGLFFYDQDFRIMINNNHAFEAFISAFVGCLKSSGKTEERPAGFPQSEEWIEFPKKDWNSSP